MGFFTFSLYLQHAPKTAVTEGKRQPTIVRANRQHCTSNRWARVINRVVSIHLVYTGKFNLQYYFLSFSRRRSCIGTSLVIKGKNLALTIT